jgi:signal transduction histidine kinase
MAGSADTATRGTDGERDSLEAVKRVAARLASRQIYFGVLDAFPEAAFILNGKRQVLYANKAAIGTYGIDLITGIGQRPGDILACENAAKTGRGCGGSQACRVCGMVNAVDEALRTGQQARREARLAVGSPGTLRSIEVEVTATPLSEGEDHYLIVAFKDLSDQKRREQVERIFFHDVLNSLNVLKSSAELLRQEPEDREYVEFILKSAGNLQDEILRQRDLSLMERGGLVARPEACESVKLLHDLVVEYSLSDFAKDKTFVLDQRSESLEFTTDPGLLRRVLGNMVKNALEASKAGDSIHAATREEGGEVLFEVRNPAFIPLDDQLRIFQRSFSTKGSGRGIGTYSMRLLTELYLRGRIGFESVPEQGTRFWVRLPRSLSERNR